MLGADGDFTAKLCPKRMCVYAMTQLVVPMALIDKRLSGGREPNAFHYMHQVAWPDVGVRRERLGRD